MCVFFFSLCIQILSVREKKPPRTLLGSSFGDLEIKLTKYFIVLVRQGGQLNEVHNSAGDLSHVSCFLEEHFLTK